MTYLSALTTTCALEFGSGGNAAGALREGWSVPEKGETWTCGRTSRLSLQAPSARATYVMVVKLRPHMVPGVEGQRLGVVVNGVVIDEFVITRRTARACLIPWNLLRDARSLEVVFTTPDAVRPCDVGAGEDQRMLGVAFSSLLLYPSLHDEWDSGGLSGAEPVTVDVGSIMAADQLPLNQLMMQVREPRARTASSASSSVNARPSRWACCGSPARPSRSLLVALENRFEGMGSPGTHDLWRCRRTGASTW